MRHARLHPCKTHDWPGIDTTNILKLQHGCVTLSAQPHWAISQKTARSDVCFQLSAVQQYMLWLTTKLPSTLFHQHSYLMQPVAANLGNHHQPLRGIKLVSAASRAAHQLPIMSRQLRHSFCHIIVVITMCMHYLTVLKTTWQQRAWQQADCHLKSAHIPLAQHSPQVPCSARSPGSRSRANSPRLASQCTARWRSPSS